MAAARKNEMKERRAVVATRTRGTPFPWPRAAAGAMGVLLLIVGLFYLALLPAVSHARIFSKASPVYLPRKTIFFGYFACAAERNALPHSSQGQSVRR